MTINQAPTYSLKCGCTNSENYYMKVREFTDEFMNYANNIIFPVAEEYKNFLKQYELEELRETEEYLLELLSFGVLWRSYSHIALSVKHSPFISLARMAEWRKKHQRIKPLIDIARGILFTLQLLPESAPSNKLNLPALEEIDHVCKWFEATGEFREQALRFIRWRAFWGTKPKEELTKIFFAIHQFTDWFEVHSTTKLGEYTENVENFLRESSVRYRWREDRISCSRTRIEYHLNMVGAELMNRAFRNRFCNTETKVVLLPGCMRAKPAVECEAIKTQKGLTCKGCSQQCRVYQLREMGKNQNFDVYIIPHASDLSLWSPKPEEPSRGVIASACVTTLVEGGWELKRYGVEAQCVLLDNCGCKKHWGGNGMMTELNIRELKRILN